MQKVLYILGQLREQDIERLAQLGSSERVPPGTVLIREGAAINAVYFVLDGHVEVTSGAAGAIATLGAGEIVGELSMIDKAPPSATVTGSRDGALVLRIARNRLVTELDADPPFAARFYRALAIFLSDRLRATMGRLGYGNGGGDGSPTQDVYAEYELDETVLDTAHLAGERFRSLLGRLRGTGGF